MEAMNGTPVDRQVKALIAYLYKHGNLRPGNLVVLGCSTSEILGGRIGKAGSADVGRAVVSGALSGCAEHGLALAVQCCEHLNRALVIPEDVAVTRGYTMVSAVPYPDAGGACGAAAYRMLEHPVLVESVAADAGIDIGDTLIGMHIRPVAVPLRYTGDSIGAAHLTMAYARPKLIGGSRARYTLDTQ